MMTTDDRADEKVSSNIRTFRIAAGLTQAELGKYLGVTFQQIQKYENGRNTVSSGRIRDLCHAFKVSPNDLFSWGTLAHVGPRIVLSAGATRLALQFDRIASIKAKNAITSLADELQEAS